jgi:hypothetical protein
MGSFADSRRMGCPPMVGGRQSCVKILKPFRISGAKNSVLTIRDVAFAGVMKTCRFGIEQSRDNYYFER